MQREKLCAVVVYGYCTAIAFFYLLFI